MLWKLIQLIECPNIRNWVDRIEFRTLEVNKLRIRDESNTLTDSSFVRINVFRKKKTTSPLISVWEVYFMCIARNGGRILCKGRFWCNLAKNQISDLVVLILLIQNRYSCRPWTLEISVLISECNYCKTKSW